MAGFIDKIYALMSPQKPQQNDEGGSYIIHESKFHQAVKKGNFNQVHSEVDRGFNVNAKNM